MAQMSAFRHLRSSRPAGDHLDREPGRGRSTASLSRPPRVLILAHDYSLLTALHEILKTEGYALAACQHGFPASLWEANNFSAILADWEHARAHAFQLPKACRGIPVVVFAPSPGFEEVQTALQAGARDIFSLPPEPERLRRAVRRCLLPESGQAACPSPASHVLVGSTPDMIRIYTQVARIADLTATVLIQGESGTGKEMIARAIHAHSHRRGPFVAVHCGAVPGQLLETALFGTVKGAYTGADMQRPGWFEAAGQGTCFLDEIADMPASLQAKLLRVLESGEFQRVGSTETIRTGARVIAATKPPLENLVRSGAFREDLYYRLQGIRMDIPPLRKRTGDIPALLAHFAGRLARETGKSVFLADNLSAELMQYPWPGNVRELAHAVERAVALSPTGLLSAEDFPEIHPLPADHEPGMPLADFRKAYARQIVADAGQNLSLAAKILGVNRRSLYRLLAQEKANEK